MSSKNDSSLRDDSNEDNDRSIPTEPFALSPHNGQSSPGLSDDDRQIGPYHLLRELGHGGMGCVWLAEQTSPIQRKVAIKTIRSTGRFNTKTLSKELITRFDAERRALALMDHRNIAKVLDAGVSEKHGPYLVMEYCKGQTITEFCQKRKLSLRQRLQVFLYVCNAVEHAHQKGIVHRDLKPQNILVVLQGKTVVPKVIDFGLVKAVDPDVLLTDESIHSNAGNAIGTYRYMSPEQAKPTEQGVDTLTDIYSLGVVLYELLTGSTPIDGESFRKKKDDEIIRMIREHEPTRPSRRLDESEISKHGGSDSGTRRWRNSLKNELDWVVLKSLNKDRAERYQTASAFAADIQRFLNGDPLDARPPSPLYRFKKFTSKHKGLTAGVATVAAVLICALAVVARYYQYAESSRLQVVEESQLKDEALKDAREATVLAETNAQKVKEESRLKDEALIEAQAATDRAETNAQIATEQSRLKDEALIEAQAATDRAETNAQKATEESQLKDEALKAAKLAQEEAEKKTNEITEANSKNQQLLAKASAAAVANGKQAWSDGRPRDALAYLATALHWQPENLTAIHWLQHIILQEQRQSWNMPDFVFGGPNFKKTILDQSGGYAVTVDRDNVAQIYDCSTDKPIAQTGELAGEIWGLNVSSNGVLTLLELGTESAVIWQAVQPQQKQTAWQKTEFELGPGFFTKSEKDTATILPSGDRLILGNKLFDLKSGNEIREFAKDNGGVLAIGPNGNWFAATDGNTVRVINAESGKTQFEKTINQGIIKRMGFGTRTEPQTRYNEANGTNESFTVMVATRLYLEVDNSKESAEVSFDVIEINAWDKTPGFNVVASSANENGRQLMFSGGGTQFDYDDCERFGREFEQDIPSGLCQVEFSNPEYFLVLRGSGGNVRVFQRKSWESNTSFVRIADFDGLRESGRAELGQAKIIDNGYRVAIPFRTNEIHVHRIERNPIDNAIVAQTPDGQTTNETLAVVTPTSDSGLSTERFHRLERYGPEMRQQWERQKYLAVGQQFKISPDKSNQPAESTGLGIELSKIRLKTMDRRGALVHPNDISANVAKSFHAFVNSVQTHLVLESRFNLNEGPSVIQVIELESGEVVLKNKHGKFGTFSPDGNTLLLIEGPLIRFFDLETGKLTDRKIELTGNQNFDGFSSRPNRFEDVAYDSTGNRLVTVSAAGRIDCYDDESSESIWNQQASTSFSGWLEFNQDNSLLYVFDQGASLTSCLSGCGSGTVDDSIDRIEALVAKTGKQIYNQHSFFKIVDRTPNQKQLLVIGNPISTYTAPVSNNTFGVFDIDKGEMLMQSIKHPKQRFKYLMIVADDVLCSVGTIDDGPHLFQLWNFETGAPLGSPAEKANLSVETLKHEPLTYIKTNENDSAKLFVGLLGVPFQLNNSVLPETEDVPKIANWVMAVAGRQLNSNGDLEDIRTSVRRSRLKHAGVPTGRWASLKTRFERGQMEREDLVARYLEIDFDKVQNAYADNNAPATPPAPVTGPEPAVAELSVQPTPDEEIAPPTQLRTGVVPNNVQKSVLSRSVEPFVAKLEQAEKNWQKSNLDDRIAEKPLYQEFSAIHNAFAGLSGVLKSQANDADVKNELENASRFSSRQRSQAEIIKDSFDAVSAAHFLFYNGRQKQSRLILDESISLLGGILVDHPDNSEAENTYRRLCLTLLTLFEPHDQAASKNAIIRLRELSTEARFTIAFQDGRYQEIGPNNEIPNDPFFVLQVELVKPQSEYLDVLPTSWPLLGFKTSQSKVAPDQELNHLKKYGLISHVSIEINANVFKYDLRNFPKLPLLTNLLCWNSSGVPNHALAELASLKALKSLNLGGLNVTSNGVKSLYPLQNLGRLWLGKNGTQFDDGMLEVIGNWPGNQIVEIGLCGCQNITDSGLRHLKPLNDLRWLHLHNAPLIDGSGLKELSDLPIKRLELLECQLVDDKLASHVQDFGTLEHLQLKDINVTDALLTSILTNHALTGITVPNNTATEERVRQLRKQFPKCEIIRQ